MSCVSWLVVLVLQSSSVLVSSDQSLHSHSHTGDPGGQETAYSHYPASEYQATAYGNANYDPAGLTAYGYSYDYPLDQENEVDGIADKQDGGGPFSGFSPLAFAPFALSFTLPLGAAIVTFISIISVSAMFLLFPQTVEVDVNSLADMQAMEDMMEDDDEDEDEDSDGDGDGDGDGDSDSNSDSGSDSSSDSGKRKSWRNRGGKKKKGRRYTRSIPSLPGGLCSSDSTLCKILNTLLLSTDCLEAASCEVSSLTRSPQFPVMAQIVKPFVSSHYYDRFANVDCSSLRCKYRNSYY